MRSSVIITLMIVTSFQTGCERREPKEKPTAAIPVEIPITTESDEAREIFLEGRELIENARFDEARELFSRAIEKDPEFALAHLYRSLTGTSAMDRQNHLQHAVALTANVSEGERLQIEALHAIVAQNNRAKGIEIREQLVQKFPDDKRAHVFLSFAYSDADEGDKAIAELEKATEIDKDFAPPYNFLGYAYRAKGEYQKAEEAFSNYIRLIPDEANPYDSMADLNTKMGRHEDAIEHYEKALALNPKFAMSQRKIGTNLVFMGRYDEGREAYRKAMEMEVTPAGKVTDMIQIARSYGFEGKYQEWNAEADKALQMAAQAGLPERVALLYHGKSHVYIEMGDLDNAARSLAQRRSVIMGSDLSTAFKEHLAKLALYDEALIAAKRKDFEAAMTVADEYKAKIEAGHDPKLMEDHHLLLGEIYLEQGEYARAIEHLEQADQEHPYTLYHLALAESEAGDQAKASELFEKVANWNQYNLHYPLLRSKAMAALSK